MKNIVILISLILLNFDLNSQSALRVAPGTHILLHPNRSLTFGSGTGTPNNGSFSMEYYWGGLNWWKPSPTYATGNFKMHLNDLGMLGINMRAMQRNYTNSWGQGMNQWACYL